MAWTVETLDGRVDREILALPASVQARLARIVELIEAVGLHDVGAPHVRPVDGKIWELRAKARDGLGRALYVAVEGQRAIILSAFQKKSQATPRQEIRKARNRAKEAGLPL